MLQKITKLCLLLSLSALCSLAQFDTATVLGTIRDNTKTAVAGANVTLRNTQTGVTQSALTNAEGDFQFVNVRIGVYTVTAEANGFKTVSAAEFTVIVNARQRVDLDLPIGEVKEFVTVTGAASQLETDSSSKGQVIGNQEIVNMPLNGRNYADLALLVPGVRKSDLAYGVPPRDASFNVNGMRSSQNNFIIDGVDNNSYGTSNQGFSNQVIQPSPDAVQEFKVETSSYSAEFGRAGGAIMNVSIKSGANQIHGSVYEFLRNTQLNATGFFKPVTGQKPTLIQNQYGGSFGGAIKKDKIFYFADYEGFRRVEKAITFAAVPSMNLRNGIFSGPIQNPFSGTPYPNNVVPASDITKFARDVLADLPTPNIAGVSNGGNNFQSLPSQPTNIDKGDVRYDQYFGSKLTAFGRYSHRLSNITVPPSIPGPSGGNSNGNIYVKNWQVAGGTTYTVNARSVFEFRIGVSKSINSKLPWFVGTPGVGERFGIPNAPRDPRYTGGVNAQSINGYTQLGVQTSNPQFQNPTVVNPKVNYSLLLGKHSLKAGYEYQLINTQIDDFNPKYGQDSYSGRFSKVPGSANDNEQFVADFLFGARNNYTLNNAAIVDYRQRMHFFYIADDWKPTRKLTVNVGLRYEYATPQYLADNKMSNFDPISNSLIPAKDGSIADRSLVNPDRNNFAPRLGIAYTANSKTVIRSAYGISYIHFNRMGGENLLAYNLPNIIGPSIDQAPITAGASGLALCTSTAQAPGTCFRTTLQGYPDNFLTLANVKQINVRANYIPKDYRTSYVQNWHFTIQRELAKNFVLDVGYVGARGNGLMILGDYNQAVPNTATTNLPLQARRPNQNFGLIQIAYNGGFLSYHGLQAKLEKRFSKGLYLLNSFTYSKAIDNASGHLETANGDNSRVNFRNVAGERGVAGYNQPFNNTTTFLYELPFGKGRSFGSSWNKGLDTVLGGWRLTAINTANSGSPVNLNYSPSSDFSVSGSPTYRPNITGNPVLPESQRTSTNTYIQYLNPATVSIPTDRSQPFGNAGRNTVLNFGLYQLDLGLHKDFLLTERFKLSFRTEAFNAFNRTNFNAPNANRSSGSFGQINSTYPARQVQFALKLVF
ncbi:TonB-dependent receptor [Bryobacter aggregatus]|uniref:TonB-dependent receptor n=1 Tax=Bryobacter aggregatus TaxID=360054 RepID=UPI0004E0FC10|nr:carboxypeptidase regulatory-like domain-containing protein [Bryobacter aggregatus]